ncbi:MAG: J domain-containing protein [Egibacteraceae bacterium]
MDGFLDAYGVLQVSPDATQAELKAAHRALVRHHHPDRATPAQRPAADRLLRDINVAYGLVRDPDARARYDQVRRVHTARRAAERARGAVELDDAALAARWQALSQAAGRWAGTWRSRRGGVSYRSGRALGRWLS